MTYSRVIRLILLCSSFVLAAPLYAQSSAQPLDRVATINALSSTEAKLHLPCEIEATVYHAEHQSFAFFAGQGRDLILVVGATEYLEPGTRVRVRGTTNDSSSHVGNEIRLEALTVLEPESDELIRPVEVNFGAISAVEFNRWIAAEVVVKSIEANESSTLIRAATRDGPVITVALPPMLEMDELAALIDTNLRVTGILVQTFGNNELLETSILCSSGFYEVVSGPSETLELVSLQSIEDAWEEDLPIFHIQGVVSFVTNYWFFVQNGTAGTFIHNREGLPTALGDVVSIYGRKESLPGGGANLICKIISHNGSSPLPEPTEMDATQVTETSDAMRIKVQGTYHHFETSGTPEKIFLKAQGRDFEVHIWNASLDPLELDSALLIEATGTCSIHGATDTDFIIHAPSLDDIRVIKRVPFWTPLKIGLLSCIAAAALIGITYFGILQRKLSRNRGELSETRAKLQLVSATVRDGILISDVEGRVLHCNDQAAKIFGFPVEAGDDLRGIQERVSRLQIDPRDLPWDELNKSTTLTRELSVYLEESDGGPSKSLEIYTAPILDGTENYLARLWAVYDLTEKQQMLRSLANAEKMQAIGRVTSGIAHDFNNLLMAIKASLEVAQLSTNSLDDHLPKVLGTALQATDRAAELVSQLLSYSRKTHLKRSVRDINKLVQRVVQLILPSLKDRGSLTVDLAPGLPPSNVDDVQIEQALLNLCLNALDAIAEKGEVVVATYLDSEGPEEQVVISIRDSGCGMSPDTVKHMFEPFFTNKETGSGLGLAMAQGTIEQHGGRIQGESELGVGSEFRVYLPASFDSIAKKTTEPFDKYNQLAGLQILVVDDESIVLQAMHDLLEANGATVHTASSGDSALEWLEAKRNVDLVLLDWSMPRMHGGEVLRHIKELYPDLMTIICTGRVSDVENVEESFGVTPDGVLPKPFSTKQLCSFLREKMAESESMRQRVQ